MTHPTTRVINSPHTYFLARYTTADEALVLRCTDIGRALTTTGHGAARVNIDAITTTLTAGRGEACIDVSRRMRLWQSIESSYVDEHLYNIQCSEICTLRNEKLHTET